VIALEKQKKMIISYIFVSITALIGYLIFIPKYSYFGAAWVTIYSELAIMFFAIYYVWKFSCFLPNLKSVCKALAASSIMGVFIYYLPASFYSTSWGLFMTLVLANIVYFAFQIIFKSITKDDLANLLNK